MCQQFINAMDFTLENFQPVKQFDIYTYENYNTKSLPQGKLGFDFHKVDINKILSTITK